ncbi:MAG: hypothetical protein ACHQTF_05920 [Gemmatimonadales bacterium]
MAGAEGAQRGKSPDSDSGAQSGARPGAWLGFQLGGVRLDVDGRTANDCDDTWDANWLSVTATCAAAGAEVVVPAAVVTSWSVERFCSGLDGLVRTGVGSAYLTAESPNLTMRVESQVPDAPITVRAELTADSAGQGHWFAFAVSRAELRTAIAKCQEILAAHPANQVAG